MKAIGIDSSDKLVFSDGSYIDYFHDQDCCERNYPDWTSLDDTGFYEQEFGEIKLEEWDGGFRINGYSVNCYSEQNGHYTTLLGVFHESKDGDTLQSLDVDCDYLG